LNSLDFAREANCRNLKINQIEYRGSQLEALIKQIDRLLN